MINEKEIRMLAAEIETLEATKESIDEQYKDAKERMFVAMNESPVVELNDLKVEANAVEIWKWDQAELGRLSGAKPELPVNVKLSIDRRDFATLDADERNLLSTALKITRGRKTVKIKRF